MTDNTKRSGVPITTVILLMAATALSVAAIMLWLDKKDVFSAGSSASGQKLAQAAGETAQAADDLFGEGNASLNILDEAEDFSVENTGDEGSAAEELIVIKSITEEKKEETPASEEKEETAGAASAESEKPDVSKAEAIAKFNQADPAQACCAVKTIDSDGTGFATSRDGKIYVLTCWHTVNDQPVLTIKDAEGKELKVKRVFVAKDRDLAAIEIEASGKDINCLPLRAASSEPAAGQDIICCVDPCRDGFVDKREGKIKAPGAASMEIDASFHSGCSGGPVVLKGTNLVLGVVSPMNRISETENRLLKASHFETGQKRYCVRADNLNWKDLTETEFGQIGEKDFRSINKVAEKAIDAGDLKKGADLLLYSARNGDKDALELWCDVTFRILLNQKNQPVLDDFSADTFSFLKEAYAGGSPGAALDLGICYLYGIGTAKDPSLGFAKIEEAVKKGCLKALYMEGFCLYCGLGVAKNMKEAFKSFKAGAEKGEAFCMKALGSYYLNDNLPSEAFPWYEKAARSNDSEAVFALGVLYDHGYGVPKNHDIALEHYKRSAQMGHAPAQSRLGRIYDDDEDFVSAACWLDLAAQKFDAEAIEKLGSYYLRGIGGKPEDDDTALLYLAFAAQLGRTAAMTFMGNFYYDQKDYDRAFEWYRQAASKEDPEAFYKLGLIYENGYGVSQNYDTSFKCFKIAADRGYGDAWVNLGIDYLFGRGTNRDYLQAFAWISKAAEADYPAAQTILGDIYCNGWGVPADHSAAKIWSKKADQLGEAEAKAKLAQLEQLEREEREKARAQIKEAENQRKEILAAEKESQNQRKETFFTENQTQPQYKETGYVEKQTQPQVGNFQSAEKQPPKPSASANDSGKTRRVLFRIKETFEKPAQSQYQSPYSKDASKAMLELDVKGPTRIHVGEHFNYAIRVKNSGSGTARNVVVKNTLPIGISLTSDPGTKTFSMKGGEMPPGCVKTFIFEANPDYAGIFIDNVSVSGENARIKHSSLCTKVINRRTKFWPEP